MGSLFDEIQQRAQKLNTDVRLGDISDFRMPTITPAADGTSTACPPSYLGDLDEIFRRSEQIWNKKQTLRPIAGMSASLRTNKDLGQLNTTRLATPSQKQPEKPMEYEGVSQAIEEGGHYREEEVDRLVQRTFERARIEAERTFLNQQILGRQQQVSAATSALFSPKRQQQKDGSPQKGAAVGLDRIAGKGMKHFSTLPSSPLAHEQNIFAQKVDASLNADCTALLTPAIRETLKRLNNREADYIWQKVFAIFPKAPMLKERESEREMRSSKRWLEHIVEQGSQYLQKEMEEHMEKTIEANLARARRGGVPGTLSRVEAYLNVKQQTAQHPVYEDGLHGSHPKWTVLFHCLRVGDLVASSKMAREELSNNSQCSSLATILASLARSTNIEEDRRIKLRAEWKQNAQDCMDVHKKAVYGLLLGFDCPEANQTIEDWLWARLFSCKFSAEPTRALRQLQTTICAQHGEKYFIGEGGSPLLYFAVLLLTGQLERAIHVLFKSDGDVLQLRVHAVHIALLAQQLRVLICTPKVSDEILLPDVHEASVCLLNLPRLVLLYVKDFELTNVNFALNYCFFLRHFDMDPTALGGGESRVSRNVFEACVSRIVYLSGERDAILGQLNQRGERVPGLVDKFAGALNISDVIGRVAFDTNVQGDPLGACRLYALANRSEEATKLISCRLSECNSKPAAPATLEAVECAKWLARRHGQGQQQMGNAAVSVQESAQFAALLQLLGLHAFFAAAAEGRHQQALELVQKLRLIPADPEDVQSSVAQFHLVPEETRPLLPELCAQLMRSIVALHEQAAPEGSPATIQLKQFAKALILYTAMIPYRFPVSTNSLLLQLQSRMI